MVATTQRFFMETDSALPLTHDGSTPNQLRELDKPDCVFTMCADDSPTPNTLESSCDGAVLWYMGNPGENKPPNFCWHCGGAVAVKEST